MTFFDACGINSLSWGLLFVQGSKEHVYVCVCVCTDVLNTVQCSFTWNEFRQSLNIRENNAHEYGVSRSNCLCWQLCYKCKTCGDNHYICLCVAQSTLPSGFRDCYQMIVRSFQVWLLGWAFWSIRERYAFWFPHWRLRCAAMQFSWATLRLKTHSLCWQLSYKVLAGFICMAALKFSVLFVLCICTKHRVLPCHRQCFY